MEPIINLIRFSSLLKAKRVTARTLVSLKKLLQPLSEQTRNRIYRNIPELLRITCITWSTRLTAEDILTARLRLIRDHQHLYLSRDYKKSVDNSLRLFKDEDDIWRSRGRLQHSALNTHAKSPIFIAPNTRLAFLIIQDAHGRYHQGIEHTIATVRQTYWIPKIRQQTRKLVQQCAKCRRFNAPPYPYPESTDLPPRRVLQSRVFQHIGLDFFDLPRTSNAAENQRYYGCIFTCTVTRLIHLEMLENMSTVEFINALRRFVARRGLPTSITCDNAPTFLLTSSILKSRTKESQLNDEVEQILADKEIRWKHITPYAPWQGGFYE
ncbi:hypothetical protein RB195_005764 [Necator americanus]|uniref:Integrase catalytic domain-containing protein n=1 Tax=Necator americanus TaxID=51031 RepID=A0ABR1BSL4_NECAM